MPASITALALAGGCFLSNPASAVQIQSRDLSGYCIDVSNANFQLGQAILLYALGQYPVPDVFQGTDKAAA